MNVVTIGVSRLENVKERVAGAFRNEPQGNHVNFASVDLLWRTMTPRRWELLQALAGRGRMTLRGIARLVGRDVKTVHGDVHALLEAGILERGEDGSLVFPYDAIHVDFTITRAA